MPALVARRHTERAGQPLAAPHGHGTEMTDRGECRGRRRRTGPAGEGAAGHARQHGSRLERGGGPRMDPAVQKAEEVEEVRLGFVYRSKGYYLVHEF